MKTMKHFLTLVATAALVAGCAATFRPWNLSEIEEGMEREQVIRILGKPDRAEIRDGAEYLRYAYIEDYNPAMDGGLAFEADTTRATQKMDIRRSLREYVYEVMLVGGKVVNYKELGD